VSTEQHLQRSRNVPAAVGLGINVLAVLLQIATSALAVLLPVLAQRTAASLSEVAAVFAGVGVVVLLLHLVGGALGLVGLVGLLAAGRPRAMAGAAFRIGVTGAVATLAGLVLPPLRGAALSG